MNRFENLSKKFAELAASSSAQVLATKKKRPAPISVRLNETELAALRKAASGRSINGYIRERLFGDATIIELSKPASKDHEALAKVLGALGRSDVFTNLAAITLALEERRLMASNETETALIEASKTIADMRADLLIALGLRKA
mmetsp:Transcript_28887/g.55060  ORF Transcript_28887/g.55060 Transcript_28887/m.55060 type:complete len:144 (+) Transcript_28887:1048-1479(+)